MTKDRIKTLAGKPTGSTKFAFRHNGQLAKKIYISDKHSSKLEITFYSHAILLLEKPSRLYIATHQKNFNSTNGYIYLNRLTDLPNDCFRHMGFT